MEAPFDLVLTLIPISLVIALRLYAGRKKKAEDAERARLAAFLAKAANSGSGPVKPREAVFDAHALVPDDDEDDFKVAANFFGQAVPPRADGGSHRPSAGPGASAVNSVVPPRLVSDVPSEIVESVRSDPAPISVGATGARTADRFFARLEKLSPLKRAIVMAEILGKPKGM